MEKTIVLIIAHQGYQPVEYGLTKKTIEGAGIKVITASDKLGMAIAKKMDPPTQYQEAPIDLLVQNVEPSTYDGVFIIGGPGAMDHLDNAITYHVVQSFFKASKPLGAICISPRILAKAGVLKGKKSTGWDHDNQLADILAHHGALYERGSVMVDGNIITADGPMAAQKFGQAIVQVVNV
jgi:protease I